VVLSNAGLSGVRIDVYNDTPDSLAGELVLVATNFLGQANGGGQTRCFHTGPFFVYVLRFVSVRERFRDLSNSFRIR